jgi:hypothetical protein
MDKTIPRVGIYFAVNGNFGCNDRTARFHGLDSGKIESFSET